MTVRKWLECERYKDVLTGWQTTGFLLRRYREGAETVLRGDDYLRKRIGGDALTLQKRDLEPLWNEGSTVALEMQLNAKSGPLCVRFSFLENRVSNYTWDGICRGPRTRGESITMWLFGLVPAVLTGMNQSVSRFLQSRHSPDLAKRLWLGHRRRLAQLLRKRCLVLPQSAERNGCDTTTSHYNRMM